MEGQAQSAALQLLNEYAKSYDLVWRDIRFQTRVPPTTGGDFIQIPFTLPGRVPLLILDIGFSSTRVYDGQIIEARFRSRERTFVDQAVPLELLADRIQAGGDPANVPPAFFFGQEELILELRRFFPLDPAEAYPGVGEDSIITVRLRGCEIWPPGTMPGRTPQPQPGEPPLPPYPASTAVAVRPRQ